MYEIEPCPNVYEAGAVPGCMFRMEIIWKKKRCQWNKNSEETKKCKGDSKEERKSKKKAKSKKTKTNFERKISKRTKKERSTRDCLCNVRRGQHPSIAVMIIARPPVDAKYIGCFCSCQVCGPPDHGEIQNDTWCAFLNFPMDPLY